MHPIVGIADFRRDNVPPIRRVCSRFVALCRDLHLLDDLRGGRARGLRRGRRRRTLGRRVVRIAATSSIDTKDTYVCPVGKRLTYRMATEAAGKVFRRCWTDAYAMCTLHPEQTTPRCSLGDRGGSRPRASTA